MPAATVLPPDQLALLRGVSRSFYISIRLLPRELQRPVAVAYLLARASDTIADTVSLPADERASMLALLAGVVAGTESPKSVGDIAAWFAPLQHDENEHALMVLLPNCFAWMAQLDAADCDDVREVLGRIAQGHRMDVARFGDPGIPAALANARELDEYTWLVAGCVGEFWTSVCARHLPSFSDLPIERMRQLGRSYGQGLQLVNILRDAGEDLAAGRCYLPADELEAAGVHPAVLRERPQAVATVWTKWLEAAQLGMNDGMKYAIAVRPRRVRAASALPAIIGTRTLALLREAGPPGAVSHKVKVPRPEVRRILSGMAVTFAARGALQLQYERVSSAGWDNPRP